MKRFALFLAIIGITGIALLNSCAPVTGRGEIITQDKIVEAFDGVQVRGSFDVKINKTESEQNVKLEGYANLIEMLAIDVRDKMLYIRYKENTSMVTDRPVSITINTPRLKEIVLNGSADINVNGNSSTEQDSVWIVLSGSGDIAARDWSVPVLSAHISGSGDIALENVKASSAQYVVNGSGDISAGHTEVAHAHATIKGSGDIHLQADSTLNAEVYGSGDIKYSGKPAVTQSVKGSGSITAE